MKTTIAVVIGCVSVLIWTPTLAQCSYLYDYGTETGCPSTCGYESDATSLCNCTDPGCDGSNSCLTRGECCAAFGNVGGR